jgi:hypothetical protein
MKECIKLNQGHFTPAGSLAALGVRLRDINLFEPIQRLVHIGQKTVKYSPMDKLYDGFITMLAGAHGLVEINGRLRSDPARPRSFWTNGKGLAVSSPTDFKCLHAAECDPDATSHHRDLSPTQPRLSARLPGELANT